MNFQKLQSKPHFASPEFIVHRAAKRVFLKPRSVQSGGVLVSAGNWLSERRELWFVASAISFRGINTLAMADSSYQHDVTDYSFGKRRAWLALRGPCEPGFCTQPRSCLSLHRSHRACPLRLAIMHPDLRRPPSPGGSFPPPALPHPLPPPPPFTHCCNPTMTDFELTLSKFFLLSPRRLLKCYRHRKVLLADCPLSCQSFAQSLTCWDWRTPLLPPGHTLLTAMSPHGNFNSLSSDVCFVLVTPVVPSF